ncbi:hypothetical protein BHM03_00024528 [Ensete ventricosum]|nr:hypothetical protein BHM03_00024528 [Ensete ventricosum]
MVDPPQRSRPDIGMEEPATVWPTRHSCSGQSAHLTIRTTDGVEKYDSMRTRARTSRAHSADTEAQTAPTGHAQRFSTIILELEGGPQAVHLGRPVFPSQAPRTLALRSLYGGSNDKVIFSPTLVEK